MSSMMAMVAIMVVTFAICIIPFSLAVNASTIPIIVSNDRIEITLNGMERTDTYGEGYHLFRAKTGYDIIVLHFTVARIKYGHIDAFNWSSFWVDTKGHEYAPSGFLARGLWGEKVGCIRSITWEGCLKAFGDECREGDEGCLAFGIPENATSARLKLVYTCWDSLERPTSWKNETQEQIEIDLTTLIFTPSPTLSPTVTPVPHTPTLIPTPSSTATATEIPIPEEKGVQGFEAIFALAGLLAVAYLLGKRR